MIRERTIHFNGYTEACRLILHGQTPEGLTSRRHIMDKIPTPHLIFCLGRGLERRARHHFFLRGLRMGTCNPHCRHTQ